MKPPINRVFLVERIEGKLRGMSRDTLFVLKGRSNVGLRKPTNEPIIAMNICRAKGMSNTRNSKKSIIFEALFNHSIRLAVM